MIAVQAVTAEDVIAPNTRQQLAEADAAMQERIQRAIRESGVTIVSSFNTYVEAGVSVGPDTVIRAVLVHRPRQHDRRRLRDRPVRQFAAREHRAGGNQGHWKHLTRKRPWEQKPIQTSLKVFTGRANPQLAQKICDYLQIPLGRGGTELFPDGELIVRVEEDVRGRDCFIVQPTCHPINAHLMELFIWIDTLRRASASG